MPGASASEIGALGSALAGQSDAKAAWTSCLHELEESRAPGAGTDAVAIGAVEAGKKALTALAGVTASLAAASSRTTGEARAELCSQGVPMLGMPAADGQMQLDAFLFDFL